MAVTDEGVQIGRAEEAAVHMDSAPSSPAQLVSGFQTHTVFMRFIRYLSWTLLTADCVAFLELPIDGSPA